MWTHSQVPGWFPRPESFRWHLIHPSLESAHGFAPPRAHLRSRVCAEEERGNLEWGDHPGTWRTEMRYFGPIYQLYSGVLSWQRNLKYQLITPRVLVASLHCGRGGRHFEWVMWCVGSRDYWGEVLRLFPCLYAPFVWISQIRQGSSARSPWPHCNTVYCRWGRYDTTDITNINTIAAPRVCRGSHTF